MVPHDSTFPVTYLVTCLRAYLLTYLLTDLRTPWNKVLLENLIGSQLVNKFPAFYGTLRFITAFTSARHLPYPELHHSSPCPHIPLLGDPSSYYPSIYACVFPVGSFPQVSPPNDISTTKRNNNNFTFYHI